MTITEKILEDPEIFIEEKLEIEQSY